MLWVFFVLITLNRTIIISRIIIITEIIIPTPRGGLGLGGDLGGGEGAGLGDSWLVMGGGGDGGQAVAFRFWSW